MLLITLGPSSVALSCCLRAANIGKLRDTGDFVLHKHTVISAQPDPDTEQNCGPAYHHHKTLPPIFSCPVSPSPVGDTVPCPVMRGPLHNARCHVSRVTCHAMAQCELTCPLSSRHAAPTRPRLFAPPTFVFHLGDAANNGHCR